MGLSAAQETDRAEPRRGPLNQPLSRGVDIRNDVVDAFEAPARLREKAAGSVPQEQRGSGAPINAARTT